MESRKKQTQVLCDCMQMGRQRVKGVAYLRRTLSASGRNGSELMGAFPKL